jgi:hypothetical protein
MTIAKVVHRLAVDDSFAHQFEQDAHLALASIGAELSSGEVVVIQALLQRSGWHDLCARGSAEIVSYPWVTGWNEQPAVPQLCSLP